MGRRSVEVGSAKMMAAPSRGQLDDGLVDRFLADAHQRGQ